MSQEQTFADEKLRLLSEKGYGLLQAAKELQTADAYYEAGRAFDRSYDAFQGDHLFALINFREFRVGMGLPEAASEQTCLEFLEASRQAWLVSCECYYRALTLDPEHFEANLYLAAALTAGLHPEIALPFWKKALEINRPHALDTLTTDAMGFDFRSVAAKQVGYFLDIEFPAQEYSDDYQQKKAEAAAILNLSAYLKPQFFPPSQDWQTANDPTHLTIDQLPATEATETLTTETLATETLADLFVEPVVEKPVEASVADQAVEPVVEPQAEQIIASPSITERITECTAEQETFQEIQTVDQVAEQAVTASLVEQSLVEQSFADPVEQTVEPTFDDSIESVEAVEQLTLDPSSLDTASPGEATCQGWHRVNRAAQNQTEQNQTEQNQAGQNQAEQFDDLTADLWADEKTDPAPEQVIDQLASVSSNAEDSSNVEEEQAETLQNWQAAETAEADQDQDQADQFVEQSTAEFFADQSVEPVEPVAQAEVTDAQVTDAQVTNAQVTDAQVDAQVADQAMPTTYATEPAADLVADSVNQPVDQPVAPIANLTAAQPAAELSESLATMVTADESLATQAPENAASDSELPEIQATEDTTDDFLADEPLAAETTEDSAALADEPHQTATAENSEPVAVAAVPPASETAAPGRTDLSGGLLKVNSKSRFKSKFNLSQPASGKPTSLSQRASSVQAFFKSLIPPKTARQAKKAAATDELSSTVDQPAKPSNRFLYMAALGALILGGVTLSTLQYIRWWNQQTAVSQIDPAALPLPAVEPSASPAAPTPSAASASPTSDLQTFREKNGRFEISFPKGYTHKTTGSGVAFVSADQSFAGAVDFGPAEGKQLNAQQLEASLKAEFSNRLQEVNWQTTQPQPDGSLRIDWTGKDKSGNALDAVSIVEQRGNYVFVLNLFGINKPYQNYNTDAEKIVSSYQVQPSPQPSSQSKPQR